MIIPISHRGNINGPDQIKENTISYINKALKNYIVEVDVWYLNNEFYLGHDEPKTKIDKLFLFSDKIVTHCKNYEALVQLKKFSMVNAFFQLEDNVSITTKNNLIFNSNINNKSINAEESFKDNIVVQLGKYNNKLEYLHHAKFNTYVLTDFPDSFPKITSNKNLIPFDLLVIDIDGVMTNGKKTYDHKSNAISKEFCDKDFTAIKRFRNNGINICFLSGDENINKEMAKDRGIDFYYARLPNGNIDKSVFIEKLKNKYDSKNLAYVGDDYYDLTIIEASDISFAPADAISDIRKSASHTLKTKGGDGVIAEIYEKYQSAFNESYAYDDYKK